MGSTRPTRRAARRPGGSSISGSATSACNAVDRPRPVAHEDTRMICNVIRLAALLLTATVAVPTASVQAQAGGGVAFVYMRAVLQQTPGYAQAESTWVAEFEGFRNEILKLQEELNTAVAKFEESSVML